MEGTKMSDKKQLPRCKIPGENFGKLIEYKTVDTSTIQGIEQAEKMEQEGWIMSRVHLFTIQYYRYVKG